MVTAPRGRSEPQVVKAPGLSATLRLTSLTTYLAWRVYRRNIVFEVRVDNESFTGRYGDASFTRVGYVNDFWITALVASFRIGLMNGDFMDITWMHSVCGDVVDIWWTSPSRPDWGLDQHKKK